MLKYFNDTALSEYIIPSLLVLFKSPDLKLNDSESVIVECDSYLENC